jgi:nucleoside-diphosphate-sugar epimerase
VIGDFDRGGVDDDGDEFIGVGGSRVYAAFDDPRWGALGPPLHVIESAPRCSDPSSPKFSYLMWVSEETVMKAHRAGDYSATYFRYPLLYGPNAPASPEWSIVRRLLDGRRRVLIPANGVLKRRGYARNVAHALLLAVDQPEKCGGQIYNIRDDQQFTHRQYVRAISDVMGRDCEILEMPPELAHRVYKGGCAKVPEWTIEYDIGKIKAELGYSDKVSPSDALKASVQWLVEHGPKRAGEIERQLGDPFAYASEDAAAEVHAKGLREAMAVEFPDMELGHMYRHPKKPGEAWSPPKRAQ